MAFPLHPETPEEGRTLEALFAGRGFDIAKMVTQLQSTAESLGLPFGERTMTYNSRRAQELGKWADTQQRGDAFHEAVFRAYFADRRNIARHEELRDLVRAVGLDPADAMAVLEERRFAEDVDADWQRARQLGIAAVPTFLFGDQRLVGAQPYAALEALVQGA